MCVYSVRELEREVFEHRPDWWEEFLVLRHVPREMISEYERDEYERDEYERDEYERDGYERDEFEGGM